MLVAALAILFGCGQGEPKSPLRTELEGVLAAKRQAEAAGDLEAWKAAVSSRHYADTHNRAVSTMQEFDGKLLRTFPDHREEGARLRFVKTVEQGDTAGLLCVRDQTKEENPPGEKDYKPSLRTPGAARPPGIRPGVRSA